MDFAPADETDVDTWCRAAMAPPALAPVEEQVLAFRVEEGDAEARERLIRASLRLVVEAARRHASGGSAILALIQAGMEGLLCAVEAFDPRSGETFTEHASGWIEEAVQRARGIG
jgi:RNA polymerase primary sigma factor